MVHNIENFTIESKVVRFSMFTMIFPENYIIPAEEAFEKHL